MVNTTIQTYATTQAAHFGMPVCAAQGAPSIDAFGFDATRVRPTDVVVLDGAFSGPHVWSPPI